MIESEIIFNKLEEIFFETLSENLDEKTLVFIEENKSSLFFEIHEGVGESWQEFTIENLLDESEDWLEAEVYILKESERFSLALILLNVDIEEEKECHIQWFNIS